MSTRAAAVAGVEYFAEIRDIAARVGVDVPSDSVIAARFAATDAIDLPALSADSSMLTGVVGTVTGAADAAFDAHGAMPDAWRGPSADAADRAIAAHVRHTQDAVDQIRVVATTVAAAASALARVQDEKHRTLASLDTDRVAGHVISTISADDVDADAEAIARDIGAAVELFVRTMDTVDTAVCAILVALTDSFTSLPDPKAIAPEMYPSGPLPRTARSPQRRCDIVIASPATRLDRAVPGADPGVLVAAISATATIAGAALAAASAVGMAAAGGVGAVLTHLIDAVTDDHADGSDVGIGRRTPDVDHPTVLAPTNPSHGEGQEPDEQHRPHPRIPPPHAAPAAPSPAIAETTATSETPERHPLRSTSPPLPTAPAPAVAGTADSHDDPVLRSQGVDAHTVPSTGPRTREGTAPPRGRPDPDDGGGLALAGDR